MNYFSAALRTCEQNVLLASTNGVKIVLGTDAGEPMVFHGLAPHDELRLLVASGLSPMDAIVAGTRTAAEYLGGAKEFGTIEAGKRADIDELLEMVALNESATVLLRISRAGRSSGWLSRWRL